MNGWQTASLCNNAEERVILLVGNILSEVLLCLPCSSGPPIGSSNYMEGVVRTGPVDDLRLQLHHQCSCLFVGLGSPRGVVNLNTPTSTEKLPAPGLTDM